MKYVYTVNIKLFGRPFFGGRGAYLILLGDDRLVAPTPAEQLVCAEKRTTDSVFVYCDYLVFG